ncbi:MAG: Peptidase S24-like [Actinomycetota bacterium]|nr:Peptidase S24-like [Actinomycetota bacterium]
MVTPRPDEVAALLRSGSGDGIWLPVDGVSMLPTISAGSEVWVTSRTRRPRIAEVWAFCDANSTIVVHRYRRRDPAGRFVFRGDNVRRADAAVDAAQLVGIVTRVRRSGATTTVGLGARVSWLGRRLAARLRRQP